MRMKQQLYQGIILMGFIKFLISVQTFLLFDYVSSVKKTLCNDTQRLIVSGNVKASRSSNSSRYFVLLVSLLIPTKICVKMIFGLFCSADKNQKWETCCLEACRNQFVFYIFLNIYFYITHCKIKRDNHQVPKIVRIPGNKANPKKIRIKIYK